MKSNNFFRNVSVVVATIIAFQSAAQPVTAPIEKATGAEQIQLLLAYSKHGSGDMPGVLSGVDYLKRVSSSFSLGVIFRGSINSDRHEILVDNQITGQKIDASIRFTSAGVQLGPLAQWHLTKGEIGGLALSFSVFGRYQSASNGSDGYSLYWPQTTGEPTVLVGYQNATPQHTVALGGLLEFGYAFPFSDRCTAGLKAGFQTDTNGDVLPYAGITIGRIFR